MSTAASRYNQLETARFTFLDRARDAAVVTIPTLVPPAGHGPQTKYPTPYQSIGSRGLNNLGAKLLLALLPPNSPFFRLLLDDYTIDKLTGTPGMRGEVDKALNKIERSVQTEVEATAIRVSAFEALKQLIVAGNVLCYLPPKGGLRVFRLDRFVVKRDTMGSVLEIITCEDVARDTLPGPVQQMCMEGKADPSAYKECKLYTWVRRVDESWQVHQEIDDKVIPGSDGTYPLDKSPWMPLRWNKVDGEDYGRGYVEEYLGDLKSLEALSKAIVQGSAAAAKVVFLVNPNGQTSVKVLAKAESGDFVSGNTEEVKVLQLEKQADFQVAQATASQIEQRLSAAFLLAASVQRQAERVTAEEIRLMASELEDALGGVYSILSQEFQLPLVTRLMFQMERSGRLPKLPSGVVRPAITTGLEALGRGHDLSKLSQLLNILSPLGPEVIAQYLNVGEYITRAGTGLGIEMDGLVKSQEEVDAAAQQAQQQGVSQSMLEKLGPKGMDIIRDQLDPSKNAPQAPPNG